MGREGYRTSGLVLPPLHRDQERRLRVQFALQEGVPLDGLVQAALKVLQRHDGGPERGDDDKTSQTPRHFLVGAVRKPAGILPPKKQPASGYTGIINHAKTLDQE